MSITIVMIAIGIAALVLLFAQYTQGKKKQADDKALQQLIKEQITNTSLYFSQNETEHKFFKDLMGELKQLSQKLDERIDNQALIQQGIVSKVIEHDKQLENHSRDLHLLKKRIINPEPESNV